MNVPIQMNSPKEYVSCFVCMRVYKEPKKLPCLHIFCLECLNNVARTTSRHGSIKCPLCQIEVAVPESGTFETLPSCSRLTSMMDILAIKECSTSEVSCGNCEKKSEEATYCFHCDILWCNTCLGGHNILRANRDHRVLALKDFQENDFEAALKRPVFCQKEIHEKAVLKFYCKICEIPLCQNCVTVEHAKHDVEHLEVVARVTKHTLGEQLEAAEKEAQTLSKCLQELENKSCSIDKCCQFVKREIRDGVKALILNLQKRELELITEVEKVEKIEQDRVAEDKTKISEHIENIKCTMTQAKHFIDYSTSAGLVRTKTFLSKLLQELLAPELIASTSLSTTAQIEFLENKDLSKTLENEGGIGHLKRITSKGYQCTVEGFNEATAGLQAHFKFITRDAEGKQSYYPGDRAFVELASTEDGTLAGDMKIVDKNNGCYEISCLPRREGEHIVTSRVNGEQIKDLPSIHVKKRSYKLVRTVGKRGTGPGEFDGPWGVAVNNRNEILVCDTDNNRLQVFSENGDFLRTIEHELLTLPSAICIDSAGRIFVAAEKRILVFNANGDYFKEIVDEENHEDAIWSGISLDEQGNVIICRNEVCILSPEGKTLKKLTRHNFCPFDCLYYDKKIFVSNLATHTIDVFDFEGKFLKEIGKQGTGNGEFSLPSGLAIDKAGQLVVTFINGFQVLTAIGKFVAKFGSDVLRGPRGVTVLEDGRYIVTNYLKDEFLIFE